MPTTALAAAALTLNALVFGLSWWPFRALQGHGVHPLWATVITYVMAIAVVLVMERRALPGLLKNPVLWWLVAVSGLTNVGFNWAVTVGDVVRAILLFYLMPAWVVVLAWPLLGERPTAASLLRLALALVGVVVVLKGPDTPWPVPQGLADWLALMGGFCFALTNIMLRKFMHTPGESRLLAMFMGGALMATAAALLGQQLGIVTPPPAPAPAWLGWALGLSLALLAGNFALQYGAARLSATTTSLVLLSEVVFASASSVLLGAGELPLRTLLGGALIMLASVLAVFSRRPA